jgi:hypothetical protein
MRFEGFMFHRIISKGRSGGMVTDSLPYSRAFLATMSYDIMALYGLGPRPITMPP